MTPGPDSRVYIEVDIVEVSRFHLVVRDLATGSTHTLAYDGIAIGSNDEGSAYTLIMPRVLARMQGFCE